MKKSTKKAVKVMTDDSLSTLERRHVATFWRKHVAGKDKYIALIIELGGKKPVFGKPNKGIRESIKIAHAKIRKELKRKGHKVSVINSTLSRYCVLSFGFPLQAQNHASSASSDGKAMECKLDAKWSSSLTSYVSKLVKLYGAVEIRQAIDSLVIA